MTYHGETEASAYPASTENKQKDRNVTLSLANRYITNPGVFAPFKKDPQVFTIDAGRDTVLVGKEGTIIDILANSLVDRDGNLARGEVQFKLNEYYKKSDMLLAGLHTMSGTTLLESAGMLYLEATSGGNELGLRKHGHLFITNPNEDMPEDMKIYQGNESNDQVNWQLQGGVPIYIGDAVAVPVNGNGDEIDPARLDSIYFSQSQFESAEDSIWYYANNDRVNEYAPGQRSVARFGYINWDKELKVTNGTNIRVRIQDKKQISSTRIIFKTYPTIMVPGLDNGTEVLYRRIPIGYKATVITMVMEDGQILFDSKAIEVSRNMILKMDPRPSDVRFIQEYLQTLDL